MELLLKNALTAHYGLQPATVTGITIQTSDQYFEIEDDQNRETVLHLTRGSGMAVYNNPNSYHITIVNYDKFLTALPHAFGVGKKRCDLIVYTNNNYNYFILNELKDRNPKEQVKNKATAQLLETLNCILAVPDIKTFSDKFTDRRCCYINKKIQSPPALTATTSFNRINLLTKNGFKMSSLDINALGFDFYEYYGGHSITLN